MVIAATATFVAASCATTSPGGGIASHRAKWQAQRVTSYQYDFGLSGFFINCNGPVHVQVTAGVVVAATDPTGQPLTFLGCSPTIDQLFDRAAQADQANTLTSIQYDPTLGYPTRIEVAGGPDASGSFFAANLQPTP